MKSKLILAFITGLLVFSSMSNLYAGGCNKAKRDASNCNKSSSMKEKFFHKVKLILKKQEILNLSEYQLKTVKDLKIKIKKELIRKNAEIDIIKVDIKVALHSEDINLDEINKLIDKKYEHKKAKAKLLFAAIVDLKKILTEEQCAKLKHSFSCKGKDSSKCAIAVKCQGKICNKCKMPKSDCKCK